MDPKRRALTERPLVHAIGWFGGRLGYNIHTDNLFGELSRLLPVVATPLKDEQGPIREDRAAIARTWPGRPVASIALLHGHMMHVLDDAPPGRRIAYTVWESTKLPDDWRAPLVRADEIWVPTQWNKDIFVANGLDEDRLRVVPEGIDPEMFSPRADPVPDLMRRPGFKFINIGKWEERKGTEILIKAFDDEFGPNEDVWLVLSCYNPHFPDIDFGTKLRALKLRRPERLLFIPPIRDHWRIAGLYTSCQAFVAPTRAEGWGLPIIEAMACDLPVIATGYSGLTEFLGAAAYRIDYRLVPVSVPFFLAADGDFGVWAEPDAAHLRRLMRHVFARPDEAQTRGRLGGAEVRQRFTWRRAAAIAADAIRASLAPVQSGIYTSPQDAMSSGQA